MELEKERGKDGKEEEGEGDGNICSFKHFLEGRYHQIPVIMGRGRLRGGKGREGREI